ncbi:hypothetical protein K438DRAFT_1778014 [Mycena galopus ATCC 62051]|nr:hypothetical protein K438DRAFT_1778014 [Mycena galopus ATCC 62051]
MVAAQMVLLEEGISPLQFHLHLQRNAELLSLHKSHSSIISPLRRMPNEMLQEIFFWSLPSVQDSKYCTRFRIKDSPWILTQICHRWRVLAISTPALWSIVAINYLDYEQENSVLYPLAMVKTQITRAQKLKVHFHGSEYSNKNPQIEVFKCLATHASSWEELDISLTSALIPFLAGLQDQIPHLRRLSLQWEDPDTIHANVEAIHAFQAAPLLNWVNIAYSWDARMRIPIFLPTTQLTSYRLDGPWKMHWNILTEALNLREAYIIIPFPQEWQDVDDHVIIYLHAMQLLFISYPQVLNYIRIPNIEIVSIQIGYDEISGFEQWIRSFGYHFHPRRMVLIGEPTAHLATWILGKNPSVVEFGFFIQTLDAEKRSELNHLLAALTITSSTTPVAAHLSSIYMGSAHTHNMSHILCLAMISSRHTTKGCGLKRAEFANPGTNPGPSIIQGFDLLNKSGENFSLATKYLDYEELRDRFSICTQ